MNPNTNHWTVTVEEDPESGDLILPLPQDLLNQAGWYEGDTLLWEIVDGNIHLTKDKNGN